MKKPSANVTLSPRFRTTWTAGLAIFTFLMYSPVYFSSGTGAAIKGLLPWLFFIAIVHFVMSYGYFSKGLLSIAPNLASTLCQSALERSRIPVFYEICALALALGVNCGAIVYLHAIGEDLLAAAILSENITGVKVLIYTRIASPLGGRRTTPLAVATGLSDPTILKILLEARADPNALDQQHFHPLDIAVGRNCLANTEMLLAAGAKPDAALSNGTTALMLAAQLNRESIARALIKHGAHIEISRSDGMSACAFAKQNKSTAVIPIVCR